jgi:hypothetical protein
MKAQMTKDVQFGPEMLAIGPTCFLVDSRLQSRPAQGRAGSFPPRSAPKPVPKLESIEVEWMRDMRNRD